MIQLKDFSIGFADRKLLENVSTVFQGRKLTALIGRNGTGKSTLMKAICGLITNYKGEIIIDGENIKNISRNKLATLIAYVNTQRPRIANLKCREVVALGRSPYTNWHGKLSLHDQEIIEEALKMVGMMDYKDRYFNNLSDGESQKIMIARAIAQDTSIILLDEPTSFLDLPTRFELATLLKKLTVEKDKTILFSTHELDIALKFSDFIALFDSNTLINLPTPEMVNYIHNEGAGSLFTPELWDASYRSAL